MSCADVCIDHEDYSDCDASDLYREAVVTARKLHVCCECGDPIQAGMRYQRASGKYDGKMWVECTCILCLEIRKVFVCGSVVLGMLWDSIEDAIFPIWEEKGPIDCLAKVESLEARTKLRTRYTAWSKRQL
jgi:hypothetical protein